MKTAIILLLVVAVVVACSVGIWYYKTTFYVPDKDGMVYSLTETITACRYTSAGGMNGEYTEAEIYLNENGDVWLTYQYRYPVDTDKEEETAQHRVEDSALADIRELCKTYGVLGWGNRKRRDIKVLDGATEEIELYYEHGQCYRVNTGQDLPEGGETLFEDIFELIERYR